MSQNKNEKMILQNRSVQAPKVHLKPIVKSKSPPANAAPEAKPAAAATAPKPIANGKLSKSITPEMNSPR